MSLPPRRESLRFKFVYDGKFSCYGTVGFHPETGEPIEIFLQVGKSGSALEALARDTAIGFSLALQHGATMERLRTSVTRIELNAPSSPIAILLDMYNTWLEKEKEPPNANDE